MKIIYDARYLLVDNRFDGVSRYTHGLAHALAARDDTEMIWLVHDERQLAKLPAGEHMMANNPEDALREIFSLPRILNRQECDVVYSPFFVMGTIGLKHRLVLTIHDMIYFHYHTPPYHLPWWIRLGWRAFHLTYWPMRWILNQASAVATVSATAKQELEQARATSRPITAVLNAANQIDAATPTDHYSKNHIVYMGAFMPYKNPECLIDALQYLPDMTLDFLSKITLDRRAELEARAKKHGVYPQVVFYNGVSDEEYQDALANARCLVTASRIEGFGLPIIEAQQQGIPVVCSDIPIFHEVGAHSVLYFDPESPQACAEAIKKLADPSVSKDVSKRGIENAQRFTWENSATSAIELIKKIL